MVNEECRNVFLGIQLIKDMTRKR